MIFHLLSYFHERDRLKFIYIYKYVLSRKIFNCKLCVLRTSLIIIDKPYIGGVLRPARPNFSKWVRMLGENIASYQCFISRGLFRWLANPHPSSGFRSDSGPSSTASHLLCFFAGSIGWIGPMIILFQREAI